MRHAERPRLDRWPRHEYGRLLDHGFLDVDDPIELLYRLLLVKEPRHSLRWHRGYAAIATLGAEVIVTPLAAPTTAIRVAVLGLTDGRRVPGDARGRDVGARAPLSRQGAPESRSLLT